MPLAINLSFGNNYGSHSGTSLLETFLNEMAELEKIGFLEQPHISAGRVPSTKGYRYYVDNLMKENILTMVEVDYINNNIIKQ